MNVIPIRAEAKPVILYGERRLFGIPNEQREIEVHGGDGVPIIIADPEGARKLIRALSGALMLLSNTKENHEPE